MPRPSLKDERSEEILSAFTKCVAIYGLYGATQERIAELAGVKRPLLRHYLGNKEEMIEKLTAYLVTRFNQQTEDLIHYLPEKKRVAKLLEFLFSPHHQENMDEVMAFQALSCVGNDGANTKKQLLEMTKYFIEAISDELKKEYQTAGEAACFMTAQAITANYFNLAAMNNLAPPRDWYENARQASSILVTALSQENQA